MIVELLPKLAAEEAAEERRDGPWRPRCSSAGTERCVRAEVYKAVGTRAAPFPGRTILVFSDGDWHEELTLDLIRRTAYKVHSEQMAINPFIVTGSHTGYTCRVCEQRVEADVVHGHIDAMVTDPMGNDFLLEHKSASRFAFQRWSQGGEVPWDYVTQCASYVWGLRLEGSNVDKALLVVKCKDTSAYLEYIIDVPKSLDPETPTRIESAVYIEGDHPVAIELDADQRERATLLGDALERFAQIVDYRDRKVLPSRPFEWDHWRCSYCPFGSTCWEGYIEESKEREGEAPIDLRGAEAPEGLADLALDLEAANQDASAAEKHAKALKQRMKVAMNDAGVRRGYINLDGYVVNATLTFQSRTGLDKDKIPEHIRKSAEKVTEFETIKVSRRKAKK